MAFDKSKLPERQRDEASIELLKKLREKLLSNNISAARVAALNLSWKQEDGLAISKILKDRFILKKMTNQQKGGKKLCVMKQCRQQRLLRLPLKIADN